MDDWNEGRAVVFELNHGFSFKKDFRIDTLIFTPTFRYAIGVQYTNLTSQGVNYVVPTDNELFAEGLLKYPAGWVVDPFISANFRTQLTESFAVVKGEKRPTAKFWDPVVSMETFGFAHTISDSSKRRILTNRVGVSLKANAGGTVYINDGRPANERTRAMEIGSRLGMENRGNIANRAKCSVE